jgi:maltose/moltooligosaccharide transporter
MAVAGAMDAVASTTAVSEESRKPTLSVWQILQMNLGFLGLQFSFGLQQANMSPIWGYLGAEEKNFAWLGIAGPLTGFLLQPIIGSMSDRTSSRWGRRTPYFLIGAVLCSLGLFFLPQSGALKGQSFELAGYFISSALLAAFSLLLLLDVGNNITMEPYRAYVNDRLNPEQRRMGFLSQSAFTGLAQCLAYLSPSILVAFGLSKTASAGGGIPTFVLISFWIGAFLSLSTILWSILRVPELPLSETEKRRIAAMPKTTRATLREIWDAIRDMPAAMRTMMWMSLFQWYAMSGYWGYVTNSISRSVYNTADAQSPAYNEAVLTNGQIGGFFNLIAFLSAFAMVPLARKYGAGKLHAICLVLSGLAMLAIPNISEKSLLFFAAIGIGIGWGSIMGNPYIVLANAIPAERTGVYMGIFNMFITAPMLLFAATMTFLYEPVLGGDARNVLMLSGVLMMFAAFSVSRVKTDGVETPA